MAVTALPCPGRHRTPQETARTTTGDPPVNVELVKMRTILELTGGRLCREPAKMRSTVRSSMARPGGR